MRKRAKFLIVFLSIIFIMFITIPSNEDVYNWLSKEYSIKSQNYTENPNSPGNNAGLFQKGNTKIQEMSSHTRGMGILMTVEKNFKYENGESLTIRGIGILNKLFPMEDNIVWNWLN